MQRHIRLVTVLTTAMLSSIAVPVFAESAPVFDVDAVQQQQFEAAADQGQDLPMPPAPQGQASEGAFVPMNQAASNLPVPAAPNSRVAVASTGSESQRLRRLEQQVSNLQTSQNTQRTDSLQEQVQTLRGQVEQLMHQIERLQAQQKAMYTDLDKRVSAGGNQVAMGDSDVKRSLSSGVSADTGTEATDFSSPENAPTKSGKSAKITSAKQSVKTIVGASPIVAAKTKKNDQADIADEQAMYQSAINLIKAKKYNEAVDAFQAMIKKYPSGQFVSNGHYWLGELYGLLGKNDLALIEFTTVVSSYPQSPRVSDAQLKVGLIYSAQSKWSDAKTSFKKVVNAYPGTASARVAAEELKQLKTSGH